MKQSDSDPTDDVDMKPLFDATSKHCGGLPYNRTIDQLWRQRTSDAHKADTCDRIHNLICSIDSALLMFNPSCQNASAIRVFFLTHDLATQLAVNEATRPEPKMRLLTDLFALGATYNSVLFDTIGSKKVFQLLLDLHWDNDPIKTGLIERHRTLFELLGPGYKPSSTNFPTPLTKQLFAIFMGSKKYDEPTADETNFAFMCLVEVFERCLETNNATAWADLLVRITEYFQRYHTDKNILDTIYFSQQLNVLCERGASAQNLY